MQASAERAYRAWTLNRPKEGSSESAYSDLQSGIHGLAGGQTGRSTLHATRLSREQVSECIGRDFIKRVGREEMRRIVSVRPTFVPEFTLHLTCVKD